MSIRIRTRPTVRGQIFHSNTRRGIYIVFALVFGAAITFGQPTSLTSTAWLLSFLSVFCLLALWSPARGFANAGFLYTLVFLIFHTGLVQAYAIAGEDSLVGGGNNLWLLSSDIHEALSTVAIGTLALVISYVIFTGPRKSQTVGDLALVDEDSVSPGVESSIRKIGLVSALLGVGLLVASVAGGGLSVESGYLDLLGQVGGTGVFGYGTLMFSIGVCFLVSSQGTFRWFGWALFTLFAILALPLGLRGTVLFLLVVLLVIEGKRRRLSSALFFVGTIAALSLISVLRVSRLSGFRGLLEVDFVQINPMNAIAEMGYSLYPVYVVQQWMASGQEPQWGVTYVAPFVRNIEALFNGAGPAATQDFRLFNVEVAALVGQIGGSPIAEAFRNGYTPAVILVMCVIGAALAYIDLRKADTWSLALSAVVLLPLMSAVRNSFAPVLPQMLIGLIALFIAWLLVLRSSRAGAL